MIDGALYKHPTLEGKLSGSGTTLFVETTNLTESEKELLKSLVYGPGDNFSIFDETVGITNSNESASIEYGNPYAAILTCDPLLAISSSCVYMGGRNISEYRTVETYCKHVINIPEVTGTIRIIGSTTPAIVHIQATYTQSKEIHTDTDIDELRDDLVVRGGFSGTLPYVLTDYTLNGILNVGTSTVTVDFHGRTTTFDVVVT